MNHDITASVYFTQHVLKCSLGRALWLFYGSSVCKNYVKILTVPICSVCSSLSSSAAQAWNQKLRAHSKWGAKWTLNILNLTQHLKNVIFIHEMLKSTDSLVKCTVEDCKPAIYFDWMIWGNNTLIFKTTVL